MSTLTIRLESVKETPRPFRLEFEGGWWEETREILREPEVDVITPFSLDLSGYRLGARLLFRGELAGAVGLTCASCAELYTHEFREPLELLLEPARERDALEGPSIELDPEDPGVGRYAGDELDFTPALRDILALAWPMQPRCVDSCRGLCSVCGTNRNLGACSCEASQGSRSLARLGGLLEQSRRTRS